MKQENISKEVMDGLRPMFKEARKKGLWFNSNYQDLWFSPDELEKLQKKGQFRWGAVNWVLRDPKEKLEYLDKQILNAIKNKNAFNERLGN